MLAVVAVVLLLVVGGALALGLVVEHQVAAAHERNRRARERARLEQLLAERLAALGFSEWSEFARALNERLTELGRALAEAFQQLVPVFQRAAEALANIRVVGQLDDDDDELPLWTCPYLDRFENRPGHDPDAVCSFSCVDEPECVTSGPWPQRGDEA